MNKDIQGLDYKFRKKFVEGYLFVSEFFFNISVEKYTQFSKHNFAGFYCKYDCVDFNCGLATNQMVHKGYIKKIFIQCQYISYCDNDK